MKILLGGDQQIDSSLYIQQYRSFTRQLSLSQLSIALSKSISDCECDCSVWSSSVIASILAIGRFAIGLLHYVTIGGRAIGVLFVSAIDLSMDVAIGSVAIGFFP